MKVLRLVAKLTFFALGLVALAITTFLASRRRALALLVVVLVLAVVPRLLRSEAQLGDPSEKRPAGGVEAVVARIIDGDTIDVQIEGATYRIRYIGMDTPETTNGHHDPFGEEATEYNRQLVEGKTVYLVKDVSETDRYGRLLRYVWVSDVFVNAELVRQGYAQILTYPPDVAYADHFLSLQREAREAGRGLWGLPAALPTAVPARP